MEKYESLHKITFNSNEWIIVEYVHTVQYIYMYSTQSNKQDVIQSDFKMIELSFA